MISTTVNAMASCTSGLTYITLLPKVLAISPPSLPQAVLYPSGRLILRRSRFNSLTSLLDAYTIFLFVLTVIFILYSYILTGMD